MDPDQPAREAVDLEGTDLSLRTQSGGTIQSAEIKCTSIVEIETKIEGIVGLNLDVMMESLSVEHKQRMTTGDPSIGRRRNKKSRPWT